MLKENNKINPTSQTKDTICLPESKFPRIVVIGGGFAGLAFIEKLKNQPFQVVLLDKNNFHQFQPLFYQVATSGLEPDSIVFPFRKQIGRRKNVLFRLAEVVDINTDKHIITTNQGIVHYDYLVLATGTTTNFFGIEAVKRYGIGMKSIRDALNIRHMMLQNLEKAALSCDENERDALTNFVIVGGGPAGVETAGALAEFCKYILPKDYPEYPSTIMKIFLLEMQPKLLANMSSNASIKTLKYLESLHVHVLLNESLVDYDGLLVTTGSGKKIHSRNLIWTAGVKGQVPNGFDSQHFVSGNRLKVNEFLMVDGFENVFVMGDLAAVITEKTPKGHPQVAQVAIQQGQNVAHNISQHSSGRQLSPFVYKDKGSLATVGKRKAVADIGKLKFSGYFAWLLWSFVHLLSISGFRNKLMVGFNWAISYLNYEKSNRVIIRNFKPKVS